MTESGQSVITASRQVRRFWAEVATLLQTADGLMEQHEWISDAGGLSIVESSTSIWNPRSWMPYYVFRFNGHKERPLELGSITVIIDVEDKSDAWLPEPVVAASLFLFGGEEDRAKYPKKMANWHAWIAKGDRKDDGTVYRVDPRDEWPTDKSLCHRMASFAWPLVAISDTASLDTKIVAPLNHLAHEQVTASDAP